MSRHDSSMPSNPDKPQPASLDVVKRLTAGAFIQHHRCQHGDIASLTSRRDSANRMGFGREVAI